jgi:hypothetical protein
MKNQIRVLSENTSVGAAQQGPKKQAETIDWASGSIYCENDTDGAVVEMPDGVIYLVPPGDRSKARPLTKAEVWKLLCANRAIPSALVGDVAHLSHPPLTQDSTPESMEIWSVYGDYTGAVKRALALLNLITTELVTIKSDYFTSEEGKDSEGIGSLSHLAIQEIYAREKELHAAVKDLRRRAA